MSPSCSESNLLTLEGESDFCGEDLTLLDVVVGGSS